jgi:thioredoxin-like negative regulator of GroEL
MEHEEILTVIHNNPALLLYFYNDRCAPCQALRPKVESLIRESFPRMAIRLINAAENPATTSYFSVFQAPTLLVFFDGKEVVRESKYVAIEQLRVKIERYYSLYFG